MMLKAGQQVPLPINEIIVKMEMKKFQRLLHKRMDNQNSLVTGGTQRIYPLNQLAFGTAKVAEAPCNFDECHLKL